MSSLNPGLQPGRAAERADSSQTAERQRFFEFQRQVRGLLAIVRSLVRRMAESSGSVEDFASHLDGRIGALARTQGLLLRTPEARVDLEELIREEFLAQAIPERRFMVSGPTVKLSAREAGTLGLALHELLINAIKFGAFACEDGNLSVTWELPDQSRSSAVLSWCESVDRLLPASIEHRGVGLQLIEQTVPYELGGKSSITLQPTGLRCSMSFDLPPQE